jgi:large subunit ribosomal protein L10
MPNLALRVTIEVPQTPFLSFIVHYDRKEGWKRLKLTREEKKALVKGFRDRFERAEAAFLTGYSGINVEGMTKLRRTLRDSSAELKIVKNTLARLAVKDTHAEHFTEYLKGPTAIAFSFKDAALTAKTLTGFAKEEPNLDIRIGTLGGKILELAEIKTLASLPSRDALLAKLLGVLTNVPAGLVGVLSGVPRKLLYALNAVGKEKEAMRLKSFIPGITGKLRNHPEITKK